MKATAGYLVVAAIFALVGGAVLRAGLIDRDLAHAEQHLVAFEYEEAQPDLDNAERFYGYASRLPWVGSGPLNEVRARKAAVQYWQRQYGALAKGEDPVARVSPDDLQLQFLVASAVYRDNLRRAKDRAAMIGATDAGIAAYLVVLKNATRHRDAAYNYEYLVRLRDELTKGRRKTLLPADEDSPHGIPGKREERGDTGQFKTYIPHDTKELEKGKGAEAGKAPPIKKKG
jgi:hypothetical protein